MSCYLLPFKLLNTLPKAVSLATDDEKHALISTSTTASSFPATFRLATSRHRGRCHALSRSLQSTGENGGVPIQLLRWGSGGGSCPSQVQWLRAGTIALFIPAVLSLERGLEILLQLRKEGLLLRDEAGLLLELLRGSRELLLALGPAHLVPGDLGFQTTRLLQDEKLLCRSVGHLRIGEPAPQLHCRIVYAAIAASPLSINIRIYHVEPHFLQEHNTAFEPAVRFLRG
mmetsp:Transcript_18941/g.26661  ORF Transcript_18941/g.26661 Transcript_18941/m.26661 type:complete len:229 (+) Transcript_18941:623-1309(+)